MFLALEQEVALAGGRRRAERLWPWLGNAPRPSDAGTWLTGSKVAALAKALKSSDACYLLLAQIHRTRVLVLSETNTAAAEGLKWWERDTNTSFTETGNQHPEQD